MQYGFIRSDVLPTQEWYIIDNSGVVIHKGGKYVPTALGQYINAGTCIPHYWVERCRCWYDTLEELVTEHTAEML